MSLHYNNKIITIFLLLISGSVTYAGCPSSCQCTENSVTCVKKNLEAVPNFVTLTNTPIIIDLSGNRIKSIFVDDFGFDDSNQVKEIYLNHSQLVSIEKNSLDELTNLQELYLAENFLNDLDEDLLANQENLIVLDLNENYFVDFPRINSRSLEVIVITKNRLERIEKSALDGLPNLRMLLLQDNNLKNVDPSTFTGMSKLFFMRLAYNPWECNCQNFKLFKYLRAKEILNGDEQIQCFSEDKTFIDIFNENKGLSSVFNEQCSSENSAQNVLEIKNVLAEIKKDNNLLSITTTTTQSPIVSEDDLIFSYVYFMMLTIALCLGFVVGAVFGWYVAYVKMKSNYLVIQSTASSTKTLLSHEI